MSDNWGGGVIDVPVVGEGIVASIVGGGGKLDCFSFFDISGDGDEIDRRGDVGNGYVNGLGGNATVTIDDS